jgi:putative SOS response-associated peptidase YedK
MCGRFTLTTDDYEGVARALEADLDPEVAASYRARFNVAPTDKHWIVVAESEQRILQPAVWGFSGDGRLAINVRAETAHARPLSREAFWSARCVVAADGFFEWTGPKNARQPIWFHRPDRGLFVFAGLYQDVVEDASGEVTRRFTVLTTRPNAIVKPYHDRMPVILDLPSVDRWLTLPASRGSAGIEALGSLLHPIADDFLVLDEVDRRVGDPRNDDPSLLEPPQPDAPRKPEQQNLF